MTVGPKPAGRVLGALTLLVFAHGAWLCLRNLLLQCARLHWVLYPIPPKPYPGCPDPYCDFSVFWLAGRLSAHPAVIYSAADFFAAATRLLPRGSYDSPFMYPPPMLPLLYLLSRPALGPGYYLFMAASVTAAVLLLRGAGLSRLCIAIGLLSPAGLWCLYLSQFGILCAGLLVAGLAALEAKPMRAGALLALLCIKPQYALLAPVAILAQRNRRAALAAGITAAALLIISGLCFGWGAWAAFLGPGSATIKGQMQSPFALCDGRFGTSVFWMARSLGAGLHAAGALQWLASLLAAILAWRLWRRDGIDQNSRLAITLCLALLASPYGYTYDMVGYSIACILLMRQETPAMNLLLALLWHAPACIGPFEMKFGILPTPLCIAAVAFIGWRRIVSETNSASPALTGRRSAPVLSLSPTPSQRFR